MKIFAKLEILLSEIYFVGICGIKIFTNLVLMTGTFFYSYDDKHFNNSNRFNKTSVDGQCHSRNNTFQH